MSVPCVRIIPEIESSSRYFLQVSAIVFQSWGSISSENFMNGLSIIGLQIFFNSGAILRIASLSVGIVPPDFGSSREEMVPPVIMIAIFGNCLSLCLVIVLLFDVRLSCLSDVSRIVASNISDSRIPIL